jgi:hypothetical protein
MILANALLPVSLGILIGLPLASSSVRIAQGALLALRPTIRSRMSGAPPHCF